jgi:hypothetical protein
LLFEILQLDFVAKHRFPPAVLIARRCSRNL